MSLQSGSSAQVMLLMLQRKRLFWERRERLIDKIINIHGRIMAKGLYTLATSQKVFMKKKYTRTSPSLAGSLDLIWSKAKRY
jgi:hypothetical protein